ncbi:MAG: heat-inducible transcriptional repressor HrcA [Candidatus Bipolaricaulota bacterium]
MDLPDRQKLVLKEVVDRYIRHHEPVSSRMILEDYSALVSSATIRNDMNDLEASNYIRKPYSSSGRVPTKKGYRFFVDWLLDLSELTKKERLEIVEAYEVRCLEVLEAMHKTAFLLGNITGCVGFVIPPRWAETRLDHIILARIAPRLILFVIVSSIGVIKHGMIPVEKDLSRDQIEQIMAIINSNLRGMTLEEIGKLTLDKERDGWYEQLTRDALFVLRHLIRQQVRRELCLEGILNITDDLQEVAPDQAMEQFVQLIHALHDEEAFAKTIIQRRANEAGVVISVGDCSLPGIAEYSTVTAGYGPHSGVLGVIGPLWMDYGKALSVTSYIANRLEALLVASCALIQGGNKDDD